MRGVAVSFVSLTLQFNSNDVTAACSNDNLHLLPFNLFKGKNVQRGTGVDFGALHDKLITEGFELRSADSASLGTHHLFYVRAHDTKVNAHATPK